MPIKIQQKANISLKPLDNYLINTKSRKQAYSEELNRKVSDLTKKPRNSSIISYDNIFIDRLGTETGGISYVYAMAEQYPNTKFYLVGTDIIFPTLSLNSTRYRVSDLKSMILSLDINVVPNLSGGFTPPSATGDYTINFYCTLFRLSGIENGVYNLNTPNIVFDYLLSHPIEFVWNNTDETWSITNNENTFYLNDYIENRNYFFDTGYYFPDFSNTSSNNSNNKITKTQYEQLESNTVALGGVFGYAIDEYSALSGTNQTHFDAYFNTSGTSGSVIYLPYIDCRLYRQGSLANYSIS